MSDCASSAMAFFTSGARRQAGVFLIVILNATYSPVSVKYSSISCARVPDGFAPVRACVQAALARDAILVEMSVIAALD